MMPGTVEEKARAAAVSFGAYTHRARRGSRRKNLIQMAEEVAVSVGPISYSNLIAPYQLVVPEALAEDAEKMLTGGRHE